MEATRCATEGKPREIAWGRSDTEATIGWTDVETVGNSMGRGPVEKERDGS